MSSDDAYDEVDNSPYFACSAGEKIHSENSQDFIDIHANDGQKRDTDIDSDLVPRLWLCRASIESDLRPQDVLDHLRQEAALSGDDAERILSAVTTRQRAATLLELLLHKGPQECQVLLDALRDTYSHLYQLVRDTAVSHTDRRRFLAYVAGKGKEQYDTRNVTGYDEVDFAAAGIQNIGVNKPDMMSLLQCELCDYYQHTFKTIRPIAWNDEVVYSMADFYSDLIIVDTTNTTSDISGLPGMTMSNDKNTKEIKDIDSMFQGPSGWCSRILLEGEPGIGKTTFCCKLSLDWAQNHDNPNITWARKFDCVIFLSAKLLEGSLVTSIQKHILADDVLGLKPDVLELNFLDPDVQSRTLLVLDAYDEAKDRLLIHDIWNGKVLRKCTMLITCRVGQAVGLAKSMDKQCVIRGLSAQSQASYILQYQSDCGTTEEVQSYIADAKLVLGHVTYIPLYLSLLCLLLDDREEEIPDTKTKLLQEVVSLMEARTAAKLNTDVKNLHSEMESLYKFAYLSLKQRLDSECWLLTESVKHMGFLVNERAKSKLKPLQNVSFVHMVFQEYLAAKYLSSLEYSEMLNSLAALVDDTKLNIIRFLAGLLRVKEPDLKNFYVDVVRKCVSFEKMSNHSSSHIGLQCLAESDYFQGLDEIVEELVPGEIRICTEICFYCLKGLSSACKSNQCHSDLVLDLDDFNKDMNKWHLLKRLCLRWRTISSVVLRSCPLSVSDMAGSVSYYLPAFPSLKYLYVCCGMMSAMPGPESNNEDMPGPEYKKESDMLSICRQHSSRLASLVLEGSQTRHMSGAKRIQCQLDTLIMGLSHLVKSSIRVLVLEEITLTSQNCKILQRNLGDAINLQAVILEKNSFTDGAFKPFLASLLNCLNLKHFQVHKCFEFESDDMDSLPRAQDFSLKAPTFKRTSYELPDEAFRIIANNKLKTLILKGQQADWSLVEFSITGSLNTLTVLDLSQTVIDGEDLNGLRKCFRQPNLKIVSLRDLITDYAILVEVLSDAKNIEELDLSCNHLGTEDLFKPLSKCLALMKMLQKLSLAACGITDETIGYLWSMFENGKIRHLTLEANDIITNDSGFYKVTAMLSLATTALDSLILPIGDFTRERFSGLIGLFQSMKELRFLKIVTKICPELVEASKDWFAAGSSAENAIKAMVPHLKHVKLSIKSHLHLAYPLRKPGYYWKDICKTYC